MIIIPPRKEGNSTSSDVSAMSSEQVFTRQNVMTKTTNQNGNTMIYGVYTGPMLVYGSPDDDYNVIIWAINSTNSANKCATINGAAHYDFRTGGILSKSYESKSHESDSRESECNDHGKIANGTNRTCVPKYDPCHALRLSH